MAQEWTRVCVHVHFANLTSTMFLVFKNEGNNVLSMSVASPNWYESKQGVASGAVSVVFRFALHPENHPARWTYSGWCVGNGVAILVKHLGASGEGHCE